MKSFLNEFISFNHLKNVQESYFQHMKTSLHMSILLLIGSVAAAVHAVMPWFFYKTASNINIQVAALRLKRKTNGILRRKK